MFDVDTSIFNEAKMNSTKGNHSVILFHWALLSLDISMDSIASSLGSHQC